MKWLTVTLASLLMLANLTQPASAGLKSYTGIFDTALTPIPGVPASLSGVFTFSFDQSLVPSSGDPEFLITPDSLTMTQLGSTIFTPANAGIELFYYNGQFNFAVLGGLINNVAALDPGTDDFFITFGGRALNGASFGASDFAVSTIDTLSIASAIAPSSGHIMLTSTAVPEPSSLTLLLLGAIGLVGYLEVQRTRLKWRWPNASQQPLKTSL